MKLKPLPAQSKGGPCPEYETLFNLLNDYRSFVGNRAAFHIEYPWWQGSFSNKEEEMDFFLAPDFDYPTNYEELDRSFDSKCEESARYYIQMIDASRDRKLLGWVALGLLVPYLIIGYNIFNN